MNNLFTGTLLTSTLFASTLLLTACGDTSNNSSDANSVSGGTPIVALTSNQSDPYKVNGERRVIKRAAGSAGDIRVNIGSYSQEIYLSNDVTSLNITDVQKTSFIDVSCENGFNISGKQTYNYVTGKVNTDITLNGRAIQCQDTYTSPLSTTVTSSSITAFLKDWGDNDEDASFISSTCPADNPNDPEFEPTAVVCTGKALTNYTVKSSDPIKTHKISRFVEWK